MKSNHLGLRHLSAALFLSAACLMLGTTAASAQEVNDDKGLVESALQVATEGDSDLLVTNEDESLQVSRSVESVVRATEATVNEVTSSVDTTVEAVPVVNKVVPEKTVTKTVAPVIEDVVKPVVEDVNADVVDPVVQPVLDQVAPVTEPVVTEVVRPVVEEVVVPVTKPVVEDVVDPVVENLPEVTPVPEPDVTSEVPVPPVDSNVPVADVVEVETEVTDQRNEVVSFEEVSAISDTPSIITKSAPEFDGMSSAVDVAVPTSNSVDAITSDDVPSVSDIDVVTPSEIEDALPSSTDRSTELPVVVGSASSSNGGATSGGNSGSDLPQQAIFNVFSAHEFELTSDIFSQDDWNLPHSLNGKPEHSPA